MAALCCRSASGLKLSQENFNAQRKNERLSLHTGFSWRESRLMDSSSCLPHSSNGSKMKLLVRAQEDGSAAVVIEEVEFVWKGSGSEVLLSGDFLNWNDKVTLTKASDDSHKTIQKLAAGPHTFKFIVDGVWQHSPDYPTVEDGAGGLNNVIEVKEKSAPTPKTAPAVPKTEPKASVTAAKPSTGGAPAAPGAKTVVPKPKAVVKSIGDAMSEDIIPAIRAKLEPVEGLQDLKLDFSDNQLRGSFSKNGVPTAFWCFFPDGTLAGSRGFSLASHGGAPSTVEPFIIDEKKITPELVVFWVTKRLFAQKLLTLN